MSISPHHPKAVLLTEQLGRAQRLGQDGQNDEAHTLCCRLLGEAEVLGLVSAELFWTTAVIADQQRAFHRAIEFCGRAIVADPLDPSLRSSWSLILRHVREALLDDDRKVDDAEVPSLYTLLADVGGADEACHIRLATHLLATSKTTEARTLLTAVVKLHPNSLDGWTLLAQVAEPGDLERLRGSVPTTNQLRGPQGAFFPQAGPPAQG